MPSPTNILLPSVVRNAIKPRLSNAANAAPKRGAEQRQQHALGEQLRDEPPARCAHRLPHRDLALAHAGARQQQIREIGAGDQQHEAGGGKQNPERILIIVAQLRNARRARSDGQLVGKIFLGAVGAIESAAAYRA